MGATPGSPTVSRHLQPMAPPAPRDPPLGFHNVLHGMARAGVLAAYRQTRNRSAPGRDQVTAQQEAAPRDANRRDRHARGRAHH